jgi:hypothetical protein
MVNTIMLQLILNIWQERDIVSLVWRHLSISLYAVVLIEIVGKILRRLANTGPEFAVLLFAYLPPAEPVPISQPAVLG